MWLKTGGVLTLILGLIHCAATPFVFSYQFLDITGNERVLVLWSFVCTGLLLVLAGAVHLALASVFETTGRRLLPLAYFNAMLVVGLGLSAVIIMPDNPFAHIGLIVGAIDLVPTILYRQRFNGRAYSLGSRCRQEKGALS